MVKILPVKEHTGYGEPKVISQEDAELLEKPFYEYLFTRARGQQMPCYTLQKENSAYHLQTGYLVGIDWLHENQQAIEVAPKFNRDETSTDKPSATFEINYSRMLFEAMRHPQVASEIKHLYEIKWDSPPIPIAQKQDVLSPFLIVEFLSVLKAIVRKGLKKSYYKVAHNLNSQVKGKVLVGQSIKKNLSQNKPLYTYCQHDEFGVNNLENRLLKKALTFAKRYIACFFKERNEAAFFQNHFNYIDPAFQSVSDQIAINEIKTSHFNSFYSEYKEAIHLAKTILKRFGYNISKTTEKEVLTPPFWIDMSLLFELYVLGLLKDRFGPEVIYHFSTTGNELDFLLTAKDHEMVIDAKYKGLYEKGRNTQDMRQLSGYARLKKVYQKLGKEPHELIDCLIIYPNLNEGLADLRTCNLQKQPIDDYIGIYKLGIKLPLV